MNGSPCQTLELLEVVRGPSTFPVHCYLPILSYIGQNSASGVLQGLSFVWFVWINESSNAASTFDGKIRELYFGVGGETRKSKQRFIKIYNIKLKLKNVETFKLKIE